METTIDYQIPRGDTSLWKEIKRYKFFYIFIAPFFIPFVIFWVWPLINSFYFSLTKWSGLGEPTFIGFDNYVALTSSESFQQALTNTLLFTVISVPLQVGLGLVFARLLDLNLVKFKGMFRTIYFTPHILSPIIIGTIFLFLLDSRFGVINYGLGLVGLSGVPWLTEPFWMRVSIIAVAVWHWTGWNTVVLLAGMQNIPRDLQEAAKIDGASELQVFLKITVPLLRPIIFFAIVIGTIGTLQMFAEPFALSANQKGPDNSAYTIVYAVWRNAFEFARFGRASAIAYVLFALTMVVTLIQLRFRNTEDIL